MAQLVLYVELQQWKAICTIDWNNGIPSQILAIRRIVDCLES